MFRELKQRRIDMLDSGLLTSLCIDLKRVLPPSNEDVLYASCFNIGAKFHMPNIVCVITP
jgi:hypothetical protein